MLLEANAHLDPELVCFAVEHPSVLALLLDAKASPNGSDGLQHPLIISGFRGQPESMQMLLDAGALCESDRPGDGGYPAWARLSMMLDEHDVLIDQWHAECMHLLMQRDERLCSQESTDVEELEQLLCDMCIQGTPTAIKTLLNVGINPDVTSSTHLGRMPPLVLAASIDQSSSRLECVRVLLHGAPPSSQLVDLRLATPSSARPPLALVSPSLPCKLTLAWCRRRQPCARAQRK